MDEEPDHRKVRVVPVHDANVGTPVQGLPALEGAAEDPVGGGTERETIRGKDTFKVRHLFADVRRTWPILDFLRTNDVGRMMEPHGAGEEVQSEDLEQDEGEE
jgi:hypothetical protein